MNSVFIMGRVGLDPELTDDGFCKFILLVKSGVDTVDKFTVVYGQKNKKKLYDKLKKADKVVINGYLRNVKGKYAIETEIVANNIYFAADEQLDMEDDINCIGNFDEEDFKDEFDLPF